MSNQRKFRTGDKVKYYASDVIYKVMKTAKGSNGDFTMLLSDGSWRAESTYNLVSESDSKILANSLEDLGSFYPSKEEWEEPDTRFQIKEQVVEPEISPVQPTGQNNGGENPFYKLPEWVQDADTLSEYLELDGYEFNILKSLWSHKGQRHVGTDEEREAKKRLHYAQRGVDKLKRLKGQDMNQEEVVELTGEIPEGNMNNSDKDIAYFSLPIRISEYALEALKAEMYRRKKNSISEVLEVVAADLEAQRGKGNPNITRYRQLTTKYQNLYIQLVSQLSTVQLVQFSLVMYLPVLSMTMRGILSKL